MHPFILMKTNQKPSRIGRRADKQGSRPPEGNQSGVEKSASGMQSSQNDPHGHQNQVIPNPDPVVIEQPPSKFKRQRWATEDYKNVLRAFFIAQLSPKSNLTQQAFDEWRKIVGNGYRSYLNPNKLANVRRDIIKKKRLTDAQIDYLRQEIQKDSSEEIDHRPDRCEPVVNVRNLNSSDIERMIEQVRNPGQHVDEVQEDGLFGEDLLNSLFVEENEEQISAARDDIIRFFSVANETDLHSRETLPKLPFTSKANKVVKIYNFALKKIFDEESDATYDMYTLNDLIYATAKAATESIGLKVKKNSKPKHHNKPPKWKQKLQKEIEALRAELSILDEISKGTVVKTRKSKRLKQKHKIKDKVTLDSAKEKIKQVMQLKAQRLRRFDKRSKFYRQNKIFSVDAKKFYREIGKGTISVENPPDPKEVTNFWNTIWGEEKNYNREAAWVEREQERTNDLEEQEFEEVSVEEVRAALGKAHKWKSPGYDKIPNFWLNSLSFVHGPLTFCINHILSHPEDVPDWITEGVTYLLPKSEDTQNPKNYRPITCLTTTYKLITSILTERMYLFLSSNNILPNEQKGCKRNSYGCKDQLLIDRMILENCRSRSRNLSTAWIDYRKAFDSVPHDWILKTLDMYKVSPIISNFLRGSMGGWKTKLCLSHSDGVMTSEYLNIRRGIFQGDSLSPLLFVLRSCHFQTSSTTLNVGIKSLTEPFLTFSTWMI